MDSITGAPIHAQCSASTPRARRPGSRLDDPEPRVDGGDLRICRHWMCAILWEQEVEWEETKG